MCATGSIQVYSGQVHALRLEAAMSHEYQSSCVPCQTGTRRLLRIWVVVLKYLSDVSTLQCRAGVGSSEDLFLLNESMSHPPFSYFTALRGIGFQS